MNSQYFQEAAVINKETKYYNRVILEFENSKQRNILNRRNYKTTVNNQQSATYQTNLSKLEHQQKLQTKMSLPSSPNPMWSKRDISIIRKYRQRIKDIEQMNLQQKLVEKEVNCIEFYSITPKEELPKFLQKMQFQTVHTKENISKMVKVFKKERENSEVKSIRRKLKDQGQIMFLSEIYQNLGTPTVQPHQTLQQHSRQLQTFGSDLQQWQKTRNNVIMQKLANMRRHQSINHLSLRHQESRIIEEKLSQLQRGEKVVNYFKEGTNYKKEIQKQLEVIYYTHSTETNKVSMYMLVENSSKLLKKELDQRKSQVDEEIQKKLSILNDTRVQHHTLFEERTNIIHQEKQHNQELPAKDHYRKSMNMNSTSSYFSTSSASNKIQSIKAQKRQAIEQIELKITKNKRLIQSLQAGIQNSQQELRSIIVGEISYYKMSLKIGMDCRDTGLGWILKSMKELLGKGQNGINANSAYSAGSLLTNIHSTAHYRQDEYEFPSYLDKKSREFLIVKTHLEDQQQNLLEQKRKFVNQIGHSSSDGHAVQSFKTGCSVQASRVSLIKTAGCTILNGWTNNCEKDKIIEEDSINNINEIPKKYRRSLKKITILDQQYAKNQLLLQMKPRNSSSQKGFKLCTNTDGLSGKQLYQTITQKIKQFNFNKAKKDKSLQMKNTKLVEYQNLLKAIKDIHIRLEDLDLQHQSHLTSHYKENKEVFFEQCAACFGYKKSYSMIIKYFSWKNGTHEHNV